MRSVDTAPTPAWREPMVWLVAVIPALSVVASIALLVAASRSGDIDSVADDVQRTSQVQQTDLGPDLRARELGLSAVLRVDGNTLRLRPVAGHFDRDAPLELHLRHPALARLDQRIVLSFDREGWQATAPAEAEHAWNVELAPAEGRWRLLGRWETGLRAVHLAPAVGGATDARR